jgi:predicted GNAT family N-acyltransferase
MSIREIVFGSPDHDRLLRLRHEVLRVPLGLSLWEEDLEAERAQRAFGLFLPDDVLAACLMAVPLPGDEAKLRQMAVDPSLQGQGWGGRLLGEVERRLAGSGFRRTVLHARRTAERFYAKHGYRAEGPEFTEVGIPHVRMRKRLAGEPT